MQDTEEPDVGFDPEPAGSVDRALTMLSATMENALTMASLIRNTVAVYREPIHTFPLSANLDRFISQFDFIFNEKVLRLDKEIVHLRREWQLKVGTFNKETQEWEYK